jgi:hypothetical protein
MDKEPKAEWVFFRNILGHWCWEKRVDQHTVAESRRSFEQRDDCVADAVRAGFDAPADGTPHPRHALPTARDPDPRA